MSRQFEEWLASEFSSLGCELRRDTYRLTSWEADIATECSISVVEDGGAQRDLEVVSCFPFAASTRDTGPVSGRVLYAGSGPGASAALIASTPPDELAEAVVDIDMPIDPVHSDVNFYDRYPGSFPDPLPMSPLRPAAAAVFFSSPQTPMTELDGRCKGLVLCYTNVSNEAARHNYLPFSGPHRGIPGLWVGAESGQYLQSVSGRATLTMRLDARLTPEARTDTIVAILPGQSDEVLFLTSHTDGPNEVNDNGALGLLALAIYAARVPRRHRRRTLVFSLPTGHHARGALADPVSGSGRLAGTPGVLRDHPDIAGRIVAHLAMEQVVAGPAFLVGHSDGAPTALMTALLRPDLVRRLVVASGVFHHDGWTPGAIYLDEEAMAFFVEFHGAVSPDGPNAFPGLNAKLDRMHQEEPTLTVADLARYPGPSLVMVGDDENEIPIEHTLAFRAGLPRSQLAIVPGTGHGLLMDKPDLCNQIIIDFLTEPVHEESGGR